MWSPSRVGLPRFQGPTEPGEILPVGTRRTSLAHVTCEADRFGRRSTMASMQRHDRNGLAAGFFLGSWLTFLAEETTGLVCDLWGPGWPHVLKDLRAAFWFAALTLAALGFGAAVRWEAPSRREVR